MLGVGAFQKVLFSVISGEKSDVGGDKHLNFDSKAELCETHFCKMNSCLEGPGGSGLNAQFWGGGIRQLVCVSFENITPATSASAGELVTTAAFSLPFF